MNFTILISVLGKEERETGSNHAYMVDWRIYILNITPEKDQKRLKAAQC